MSTASFPRRRHVESELQALYSHVRRGTLALAAPLSAEDMAVQSMPDASPTKWHLAHTTWFFETFVLSAQVPGYVAFDPRFGVLFNSYYEALGPRQPRAQRALLTRPTLASVLAYREHVDHHMLQVFDHADISRLESLIRLGLAHEEQHQELILMDILHLFAQSPLLPTYAASAPGLRSGKRASMLPIEGGLMAIGHAGDAFAFDNERPQHKVWVDPFLIADRLVTNGEWREFIDDGGYRRAELWLSDGWTCAQQEGWQAPLYWRAAGNGWRQFTLRGEVPLDDAAPVAHVSHYEADAYARWAGARLPSEAEWEVAARGGQLEQVDDALWQWTRSAYSAYPGFSPAAGAVGEYNGKFMVNQMTLRGGAAATPRGHTRPTYRNFYGPDKRWCFSGVRLARDGMSFARSPVSLGDDFRDDVKRGFGKARKSLPPKHFYDAEGSRLFEAICRTPEYYPTRVETALLRRIAPELAESMPVDTALVEFGSGASEKTRILLDAASTIAAYVPIDIDDVALREAASRIADAYPNLQVTPVHADFTRPLQLPAGQRQHRCTGFFPGSTIGNFDHDEAVAFLCSARLLLGDDPQMILGLDLVKDPDVLQAAYNDAEGFTARFNKNLLTRINRELGGDLAEDRFEHLALWNEERQRIEMHLVSLDDQLVRVGGQSFAFKAGERLHTENAHKFTVESATRLAAEAGWVVERHWVDEALPFAIMRLVAAGA